MQERLAAILAKPERLVVGLMSGTSIDAVDAALVRLRGAGLATRCDLLHFRSHAYEPELRQRLLEVASGAAMPALELAALDFRVAATFAQAALRVVEEAGRAPEQIDLIGSHGQTLAHRAPEFEGWDPTAATWQAGSASAVAALTGIPVVADFRSADVALGGTGAPLVPYADYLLRRSAHENRILLNIGGIANITYLAAGCGVDEVLAWDVGPGNMVLDALAHSLLALDMDVDGAHAAAGTADVAWVETLLADEFFQRAAPKAAGREQFGAAFVQRMLRQAKTRALTAADLLATAVELTARAIARECHRASLSARPVDAIYVSGGGRANRTLMRRLQELLSPARVCGFEALGLDPAAKEAVDFALLAHETLHGHASNLTQVTGAQRPCILGSIALSGMPPRPLAPAEDA
ncbi:MAG: anhydro-N-acetylmuramic acid kinase [Candidatus Latescibacterota bacterium]|nr:MAG: anhydro-N-acetylmuramic acid kinase [Candidatus Latescibacterota bacterium]